MFAALLSALAVLFEPLLKELVGLAWKRTNEPHLARDAPTAPDGVRRRFTERVRKQKSGLR